MIVELFQENCSNQPNVLGKKAENLAVLVSRGVNVPRAYGICYEIFKQAIMPYNQLLRKEIREKSPEEASNIIRKLFLEMEINPNFQQDLDSILSNFPEGTNFAVRSSGFTELGGKRLTEDSADTSLAGQYESFLMVPKESVADAVRRCWSSYFNTRSIRSFDARKNEAFFDCGGMSVIIQQMIEADVSAVMMTRDPIEKRNVLGIESTYGACEALVSGKVTGDLILIDRETGEVVEREVAQKNHFIRYRLFSQSGENYDLIPTDPEKVNLRALSDKQEKTLYNLGMFIESVFGVPQDIEVVFEGDVPYVVQSRNITTIKIKE